MGLWVRAGSWSSANLTDGFVPTHMANAMANPMANPCDPDALVEAGLWDVVEGGFRFHDWEDFQPSAEVEREKRKKRAEAGRLGAMARWGGKDDGKPDGKRHSKSHADGMANEWQTDAPSRPVPSRPLKDSPEVADAPPRPDVERICTLLADRIEANGVKRPTITKKWRDDARLLMDKDGYPEDEIVAVLEWCQRDPFWRTNILSMPKLRAQFAQLKMKAGPAAMPGKTISLSWADSL